MLGTENPRPYFALLSTTVMPHDMSKTHLKVDTDLANVQTSPPAAPVRALSQLNEKAQHEEQELRDCIHKTPSNTSHLLLLLNRISALRKDIVQVCEKWAQGLLSDRELIKRRYSGILRRLESVEVCDRRYAAYEQFNSRRQQNLKLKLRQRSSNPRLITCNSLIHKR